MSQPLPRNVKEAFDAVPKVPRLRLLALRDLIFRAAEDSDAGPLEETLKWGQAAYLPRTPRTGTTIRLGWIKAAPDRVSLFVPCQTTLVDSFRDRFPDAAQYDGNRAIHLPTNTPFNDEELHQIAAMALTYHRAKRARR